MSDPSIISYETVLAAIRSVFAWRETKTRGEVLHRVTEVLRVDRGDSNALAQLHRHYSTALEKGLLCETMLAHHPRSHRAVRRGRRHFYDESTSTTTTKEELKPYVSLRPPFDAAGDRALEVLTKLRGPDPALCGAARLQVEQWVHTLEACMRERSEKISAAEKRTAQFELGQALLLSMDSAVSDLLAHVDDGINDVTAMDAEDNSEAGEAWDSLFALYHEELNDCAWRLEVTVRGEDLEGEERDAHCAADLCKTLNEILAGEKSPESAFRHGREDTFRQLLCGKIFPEVETRIVPKEDCDEHTEWFFRGVARFVEALEIIGKHDKKPRSTLAARLEKGTRAVLKIACAAGPDRGRPIVSPLDFGRLEDVPVKNAMTEMKEASRALVNELHASIVRRRADVRKSIVVQKVAAPRRSKRTPSRRAAAKKAGAGKTRKRIRRRMA